MQARKRLNERARAVTARVLQDLGLSPMGRELGRAIKTVRGRDNRSATFELMNRRVNEHLGIDRAQRGKISAEQAEDALAALDTIGDEVVREVRSALLHGSEQIADLPVPVAESPGAVRIGHPERGHLVEYLAPNSVFNSLPRQRSSPHLRPDDRLVTIDRVFHHASLGAA